MSLLPIISTIRRGTTGGGGTTGTGPAAQLFFLGDSITRGIGTTGTGASSTNPPVIGNVTYPKQCFAQLNNPNAVHIDRGFSGQNAQWFNQNGECDNTIAMFDTVNYTERICVVFFGTNDCEQYTNMFSVHDFIKAIHVKLRAAGAKTIVVPNFNRGDVADESTFNTNRLQLFNLLQADWNTFADGFADTSTITQMWPEAAVFNGTYFQQNDVDGRSYVHPTDTGAGLIAGVVANAIKLIW